jgi:hypothetical protein
MKDYSDFPPFKYFLRVLKSCPDSALLYAQIWQKRGAKMCLVLNKREVRKNYLISPTMFRNLLAPLAFLNLINFNEDDEGRYQIDVSGPHLNE